MVFEWDQNKRAVNLAKHKIDLVRGAELFDGRPVFSYPSPRDDEHRTVTVGVIDGELVALVTTERSGATRLISLRRARDGEKRTYHARFG